MAMDAQVSASFPPQGEGFADTPPDERSDGELLVIYRESARGSWQRTAACEALVRRYASLVRACVRPYRDSTDTADDLMQVGYVGLLKAIGNYDPAFGNGLAAYALPCITGEVKRHFRDKQWQVRVSRTLQEMLLEIRGVTEDLTHELGRMPLDGDIANRLGVTPEELREARQAADGFTALSLNAPAGGGEDPAELGDLLGWEDSGFEQAASMEAVERHWSELPRREQRVLLMRFYGNLTQEEVAARLGISQMHVSRLQARALARLRERLLEPDSTQRPRAGAADHQGSAAAPTRPAAQRQ